MTLINKSVDINNKVACSFYDYEDYTLEKACKIHFMSYDLEIIH